MFRNVSLEVAPEQLKNVSGLLQGLAEQFRSYTNLLETASKVAHAWAGDGTQDYDTSIQQLCVELRKMAGSLDGASTMLDKQSNNYANAVAYIKSKVPKFSR
jgi:uncharacterized protein YukE